MTINELLENYKCKLLQLEMSLEEWQHAIKKERSGDRGDVKRLITLERGEAKERGQIEEVTLFIESLKKLS